jgi:hypothetical protein
MNFWEVANGEGETEGISKAEGLPPQPFHVADSHYDVAKRQSSRFIEMLPHTKDAGAENRSGTSWQERSFGMCSDRKEDGTRQFAGYVEIPKKNGNT